MGALSYGVYGVVWSTDVRSTCMSRLVYTPYCSANHARRGTRLSQRIRRGHAATVRSTVASSWPASTTLSPEALRSERPALAAAHVYAIYNQIFSLHDRKSLSSWRNSNSTHCTGVPSGVYCSNVSHSLEPLLSLPCDLELSNARDISPKFGMKRQHYL